MYKGIESRLWSNCLIVTMRVRLAHKVGRYSQERLSSYARFDTVPMCTLYMLLHSAVRCISMYVCIVTTKRAALSLVRHRYLKGFDESTMGDYMEASMNKVVSDKLRPNIERKTFGP